MNFFRVSKEMDGAKYTAMLDKKNKKTIIGFKSFVTGAKVRLLEVLMTRTLTLESWVPRFSLMNIHVLARLSQSPDLNPKKKKNL